MTTKANIIIIEDEKNICSFIEHILEPQGYRVISAKYRKGRLTVHHFRASRCDPVRLRSAGYGRLKAH